MLTAILILALVAVAIAALASATTSDAKRTIRKWESAQLDQMLLAGAADAVARLKSGTSEQGRSWSVDIPDELAGDEASVNGSITSSTSESLSIQISARLGDRRARQILTFKRAGASWQLADAKLED